MHIDSGNVDALPGFTDIWNKLLDVHYLEILTKTEKGLENPMG